MRHAALDAGQADVSQTRSASLRTEVKDVVTRAVRGQGLQRLHSRDQADAPSLQPADALDIAGRSPA